MLSIIALLITMYLESILKHIDYKQCGHIILPKRRDYRIVDSDDKEAGGADRED